jgi:hypothetical protein
MCQNCYAVNIFSDLFKPVLSFVCTLSGFTAVFLHTYSLDAIYEGKPSSVGNASGPNFINLLFAYVYTHVHICVSVSE